MDGAIGTDAGRAIGDQQVQITGRDLVRVNCIGEPHFLGECIGVQPVDQTLAPTGDDRGLGVMHMRIHKPRHDQVLPVIGHLCLGIGQTHRVRIARVQNMPVPHNHRAPRGMARRIGAIVERVAVKAQGLTEEEVGGAHDLSICAVIQVQARG